MKTQLTVDQLEKLKTHELADLLANVVLLLRRMPNVECRELIQQVPQQTPLTEIEIPHTLKRPTAFTQEELKKKTVAQLKDIASDLRIPVASKMKKDELISKILSRATHGHSEQYAIQDL